MNIADQTSQNINRETADQASHFAASFGIQPAVERHLHNLLKDVCIFGMEQGVALANHFHEKDQDR